MKNIKEKLSFALILTFIYVNMNAQNSSYEKLDTMNVAISEEIISNVNRTDAKATVELVLNEILDNSNYDVSHIEPEIFNSIDEIKRRVKENRVDIIGVSSLNYLQLKQEIKISPIFSLQKGKEYGINYILVVPYDTKISSLSDLKSKKILTLNDYHKEIVNKWLYVEMKKEKIDNPSVIIDTFTEIPKPSKRVFSLFFKKADGCLLSKTEFESICELNPQLSKKLKILIESPSYLTHLFCGNDNSNKKGISVAKDFVKDVDKTEKGSEMLKLFKAVKFNSFKEDYLKTIEKLSKDFNYYKGSN